ncbi:mucin-2-like [Seriola lalandi dorsalis]|uniref:mucin-2-like n=1 Tax=Seriola lalandi dorsalis TaxID=1841481 RepID=UPI000C6FC239|nr:mucin-2-like [Seriola lalandi dorsalis]
MSICLLLLLVCSSQASHFLGTVMTYYPKTPNADGSVRVAVRYKLSFGSCAATASWSCHSGYCGNQSFLLEEVFSDSGEWCQREGRVTQLVPSNAQFQLLLGGGDWISDTKNGITSLRAVTLVDLKSRSDTGKANTSPQTTILPAVRVPSNCQRDFNLLAFDPDGDEVKCRYGDMSLSECNTCTPPSVLSLASSCSLSFSPTSSSNEGPYAVQLVMEDFPRQTITLNQTSGSQEVKTPNDAISKIPVQFVLWVDPPAPSCTEGLYLPRFLPPTPANRARLYTPVNQSLEISIKAEANISTVSKLVFSGPHNVMQTAPGGGQFTLRWTPSEAENGESHSICFLVQADDNLVPRKYHSELRCVVVTVGPDPTTTTTTPTTTTTQALQKLQQPRKRHPRSSTNTTTLAPRTNSTTNTSATTTPPPSPATPLNITTTSTPTTTTPAPTTNSTTTNSTTTTTPPSPTTTLTTTATTSNPTTTTPATTTNSTTTNSTTTTTPPSPTTTLTTTATTSNPTTTTPATTTNSTTTNSTTTNSTTTTPPPSPTTTLTTTATTSNPTTTTPATTTSSTTTNSTTTNSTTTTPPPSTTTPLTTTATTSTPATTTNSTTTNSTKTTPPPSPTTTLTTTATTSTPNTTTPATTTSSTTTNSTTTNSTTTTPPPSPTTPLTTTTTTTTSTPTSTTPATTTTETTTTTPPTSQPTTTTPINTLNRFFIGLRVRISSLVPLDESIGYIVVHQLYNELRKYGLPEDVIVRVLQVFYQINGESIPMTLFRERESSLNPDIRETLSRTRTQRSP